MRSPDLQPRAKRPDRRFLSAGWGARARWTFGIYLAFAAIACGEPASSAQDDAFGSAVHARIAALVRGGNALGEPILERAALARFYGEREGRAAWLDGQQVDADLAKELLAAVRGADRHGLPASRYHLRALERAVAKPGAKPAADRVAILDVLLSDAFLHLAHHLADGATDPKALDPDFGRAPEPRLDTARTLAAALDGGAVGDALAQSAPQNPEYASLMAALERLRTQKAAAARADRVRANLERWRWAPRDLGARHLRVNVASFGLQAFEEGQVRLDMRVVVGERDWRTPLVSSAITRLVLHPDWRVPESIATREMLPAAQRDAGYFAAQGIQVLEGEDPTTAREVDAKQIDWDDVDAAKFPYHLRQPPGPHNPLGQIKFAFENRFGVYLHGTPADRAFTRGVRALSHGCVRVEDEVKLAEFALAPDPSWTHERLVAELARDPETEKDVPLPQPLPVHLFYFTAFAQPDGQVSFGPDPYAWDPALVAALATAR